MFSKKFLQQFIASFTKEDEVKIYGMKTMPKDFRPEKAEQLLRKEENLLNIKSADIAETSKDYALVLISRKKATWIRGYNVPYLGTMVYKIDNVLLLFGIPIGNYISSYKEVKYQDKKTVLSNLSVKFKLINNNELVAE